jgi:type II restriction/modification system DNA methylase subunit YeeA
LFERGLDPDKRSQLGAHYTDRDKIMLIVEPVIIRPWLSAWEATKAEIAGHMAAVEEAKARQPSQPAEASRVHTAAPPAEEASLRAARAAFDGFMQHLRGFRVLDPACGSGNFLYLALLALKDVEHRVAIEAETLGLPREFPRIGPEAVKGIEINSYAAELARVTVWIGEIQWMRRSGFDVGRNPILKPLDTIECRDAILNGHSNEAEWPEADAIIGNPPFLGGKLMRTVLGDDYVERPFAAYNGQVPAEADLVTYWFAKAWKHIDVGQVQRAGLVATNSIRGGASRNVLDCIAQGGAIYDAWDDEPWIRDGAAVRVSLICFANNSPTREARLDGRVVQRVNSDLTGAMDLTGATPLVQNRGIAFMGDTKGGAFDVRGELARDWLLLPLNPNGRPNSDVLRPWMNGMDLTRQPSGRWIIDFGWKMSEREAALYEAPYAYLVKHVRSVRLNNRREAYAAHWWRHVEPRPGMWRALEPRSRYIATPTVAKHRIFCWIDKTVCPDHQLIIITHDDDITFGVLHSCFHEAWTLGLCTWLGVGNDPRYTRSTTFETFPFPEGLTPNTPPAECDDGRAQSRLPRRRGDSMNCARRG